LNEEAAKVTDKKTLEDQVLLMRPQSEVMYRFVLIGTRQLIDEEG